MNYFLHSEVVVEMDMDMGVWGCVYWITIMKVDRGRWSVHVYVYVYIYEHDDVMVIVDDVMWSKYRE
jgi:hypothetical protein